MKQELEEKVGGKRRTRGYHPKYGEAPFATLTLASKKRQKTSHIHSRRVTEDDYDNQVSLGMSNHT